MKILVSGFSGFPIAAARVKMQKQKMSDKIKLHEIPANDLLPYNYVFGLTDELKSILSRTTCNLMRKSEDDLYHKHVNDEDELLVQNGDPSQIERRQGTVNEFGGSFEDYNVVVKKFISQAIHPGHERHHHETLMLDASLTHVCFMNSILLLAASDPP